MIKTNSQVLFALLFSSLCFCQPEGKIRFNYDEAGNQTSRFYILISNRTSSAINATAKKINDIDLYTSDISEKIKYFPNPVKEELFVQWTNDAEKSVEKVILYNSAGQQLQAFKMTFSENTSTISFKDLPSGFFSVELFYTNGELKNLKVIKQ